MSIGSRVTRVLAVLVLWPAVAAGQDESLLSVLRDEAAKTRLEDARADIREGRTLAGVSALLEGLAASRSAVVRRGDRLFVGLREAALREISKLGPRGRAMLERLIGTEAGLRLRDARRSGSADELARVAERYAQTRAGHEARMAAGDRFLEAGRVVRALVEFGQGDASRTGMAARIKTCEALLGRGHPVDAALADFVLLPSYWPAFGGGLDGARFAADSEPFVTVWSKSLERLEDVEDDAAIPNVHAVADGQHVFVNTGTALYAIALGNGEKGSWHFPGYLADIVSYRRDDFLGSVSPHMAHSAAVGNGVVVAPIQVPVIPKTSERSFSWRGRSTRLPYRRLHAFDARTGKLLWRHWASGSRAPAGLGAASLDVSGPPLIIDDTVYVATHKKLGGIAFYLSAFRVTTGRLVWETLICTSQIEADRHGNPYTEFVGSPLAMSGGALFGATHLGACFSVRIGDGSIRWLRSYPIIELPRSSRRWGRPALRRLHWANNAPVVADGVLVLTPIDSDRALGLDARTGGLLWTLSHELHDGAGGELRWLLGAADGQAWFTGHAICKVALHGDGTPVVVARLDDAREVDAERITRGLLSRNRIYHASPSAGLVVLDHEGNDLTDSDAAIPVAGNLCASAGLLLSIRPGQIRALFSK